MPRIRPCPRPLLRVAAIVAAAAACWSAVAAVTLAAPSAEALRELRSRLDAQDAAIGAQLDAEQATLSGGRARLDRGRLNHHEPRPADRTAAQVDEVPVCREPIDRAVLTNLHSLRGQPRHSTLDSGESALNAHRRTFFT